MMADQADIPVIDISSSNASAAAQLLAAARDHGFVFVSNDHASSSANDNRGVGVPPSLIADMFRLSQSFFALPADEKEKVSIRSNAAGENTGWLGQGVEKLDPRGQKRADVKEAFNLGEPVLDSSGFSQALPGVFQDNVQTILSFHAACHALCMRVLRLFATALEIPDEEWFTARHDRSKGKTGTVFRMLYYPAPHPSFASAVVKEGSEADRDVRAGAHSDYGSVTCLFQLPGQPGLEIRKADGSWAPVPVNPPSSANDPDRPLPILLNIGDLLEDWTGGLLRSTVHRVVFPAGEVKDRYSLAYFCHPLDDVQLEPVPSAVVREFASKSKGSEEEKRRNERLMRDGEGEGVVTARDHLMRRLRDTYTVK